MRLDQPRHCARRRVTTDQAIACVQDERFLIVADVNQEVTGRIPPEILCEFCVRGAKLRSQDRHGHWLLGRHEPIDHSTRNLAGVSSAVLPGA